MADPSPRHIGEILEAPETGELQALAESQGECEVVVLDSTASERVVLRLIVVGFEWADPDPRIGSTWKKVRVEYESAASADTRQRLYSGHFKAEQTHDFAGNFNFGTMDEF